MNMSRNYSLKYLNHGVIAAVAVWGATSAFAAEQSTDSATTSSTLTGQSTSGSQSSSFNRKEQSFLKEAAEGGQAEVEMGQMAAEKAQNAEVKRLGQRLVQDHTKANQELMQIAQKSGVMLPTESTHKENHMTQQLQDKTGAEFDKAFAQHALTDHEKDIRKYQSALQDAKDPEVKAFIQKSLPILRQHLEMARTAGAAVGVDQKTLSAADQFLSSQHQQGLGTAPSSETGSGSNQNSSSTTTPDSSSRGAKQDQNK